MNQVVKTDLKTICRNLLDCIGEEVYREGLRETPARFEKAYKELFSGYRVTKKELKKLFKLFDSDTDSMVVETDVPIFSHCEHHILPFFGTCNIGYLPDGKVIGASKLARITEVFSRRLNLQENLTENIAKSLMDNLGAKGVMVTMRCMHLCMIYRGVKTLNTAMITSTALGVFRDAPVRHEFFELVKMRAKLL